MPIRMRMLWSRFSISCRQADRGKRLCREAFASADEAELFGGRGLDRDGGHADAGDLGDAPAYGLAVRPDLRRLAQHGRVEMVDNAAEQAHALGRKGEKAVGRSEEHT